MRSNIRNTMILSMRWYHHEISLLIFLFLCMCYRYLRQKVSFEQSIFELLVCCQQTCWIFNYTSCARIVNCDSLRQIQHIHSIGQTEQNDKIYNGEVEPKFWQGLFLYRWKNLSNYRFLFHRYSLWSKTVSEIRIYIL